MAEAGLEDGFDTTIWWNIPNAQRSQVAEMVQFALREININVEVIGMEWSEYLTATENAEHDMFILGWTTVTGDPDYGLFPLFHSSSFGAVGNRTFFASDHLDALLEAGRSETDPAARLPIYREAMEYIHAAAPWVFLIENFIIDAADPGIRNFTPNPALHHNFATIYFD